MTDDTPRSNPGAETRGGAEQDDRKKKLVRTGVAVGIGSAAIVAALLYANRGKRSDKGGNG